MSKVPVEYIKHIADECAYILTVSDNLSMEAFLKDETLKRAMVRSLEIIGEAAKKVPANFKEQWTTIQWKSMDGMRDRLIHDYMGINYNIVWDVIRNKIPELHLQVKELLGRE
jgi:uncharacterized protein with HEPN domain